MRWLIGGTLLYRVDFWRRAPFPAMQQGEDTSFLWSRRLDRVAEPNDLTIYVALIHPNNTCPKQPHGAYWSAWAGDIAQIMGGDSTAQPTQTPPFRRVYPFLSPSVGGRTAMKLNLGCCDAPLPGYVNVDVVPGPGVEAVDLREPWPWPDSTVDEVRAADIIEHLPDKIRTMNELWRVLKPGGTAEVIVPTTDGTGAFQDPTHVSFWNRRSFLYYEAGNPYRERFARYYGITANFRIVREHVERTVDGPRLTIVLEAVKSMSFSVVIPSARAQNLIPCVRAILDREPDLPPDRIIVVDDGARADAEAHLPPVRWVTGIKPFVFARNANLGIRTAATDVILLNDDTRPVTPRLHPAGGTGPRPPRGGRLFGGDPRGRGEPSSGRDR